MCKKGIACIVGISLEMVLGNNFSHHIYIFDLLVGRAVKRAW